jgi:hypothetical protein
MRWLSNLLEETMYKHYLENNPDMVSGIRQLLTAGESPKKIKKFCEGVAGKSMTSNCVSYMIDYVNRQVKN